MSDRMGPHIKEGSRLDDSFICPNGCGLLSVAGEALLVCELCGYTRTPEYYREAP